MAAILSDLCRRGLRGATMPLLLGSVGLVLAACATPEPPLPPRPDIPYGQGRIWKVEGEGIEASYVFGTFHISDPRVLDLPEAVETAFVASKTAAFEYDYGPEDDPAPTIDFDRYKLPEETTLRSVVGAGTFGKLTSIMKGKGFWRPRNDLKPWAFWDYLGGKRGTFYTSDDKSDPNKPVLDAWLQHRAYEEDKKVVGLETVEAGFVKYDSIPMDLQAQMLESVVDNYHRRRAGTPLVQAYLDGDLALLEAVWREGLSWYPPEVAELLDHRIRSNRNRIMVDVMLPLMEEDPTFVAVGAGHLAGEEGILRQLEQRGFTVTRLY